MDYDNLYELEDTLIQILGYEQLCIELLRQMSFNKELEALTYIARMYDIDISDTN